MLVFLCALNLSSFSSRKTHHGLLTPQKFTVWSPNPLFRFSFGLEVCWAEGRGVPLIHVVYINAIHDVYPNSAGSSSPYGIHVCVLLKYNQNPHFKEFINCNINKAHASAFVIAKAVFNQREILQRYTENAPSKSRISPSPHRDWGTSWYLQNKRDA